MKIDLILSIFYQPPEFLQDYVKHNRHLYIPLNTGNLKGTNDWCDKHLRYEIDFKENIASLNPKLNEMTLIWCYWKNLLKPSVDYVGLNHYRRFFRKVDMHDLYNYDILDAMPLPMMFKLMGLDGKTKIAEGNIELGYKVCHVEEDWNLLESKMRKHPLLSKHVDAWKNQDALTSPCNMFLMRRELFEKYCETMFPILFELEREVDLTGRDAY